MVLQLGDPVDVRFGKWGGGRHWEFSTRFLGVDGHGPWVAADVGCHVVRPGKQFHSAFDWVMLLPPDQPWVASFYDHAEQPIATWVDITTPAGWDRSTVSMVDLDLDVILFRDGRLELDDADEFALHQVTLGYPRAIVELAERTATNLLEVVGDRQGPFAGAGAQWLEVARHAGSDGVGERLAWRCGGPYHRS